MIDASCARLEKTPPDLRYWYVQTWESSNTSGWFIAEVVTADGDHLVIGDEAYDKWQTNHSRITSVSAEVRPPKE